MSVTISAFPFLLLAALIQASAAGIAVNSQRQAGNTELPGETIHRFQEWQEQNTSAELPEQEFHAFTAFMDKDLLIKTLKEHGCDQFKENFDNSFSCRVEGFKVDLYRQSEEEPYRIKISCAQDENYEEFLGDLNSEYALNTQEETYIKIKERLSAQNLKINEEEILEDNTIMLTINLE